jgi:hypothetical protein
MKPLPSVPSSLSWKHLEKALIIFSIGATVIVLSRWFIFTCAWTDADTIALILSGVTFYGIACIPKDPRP